jgi:L-ascorbate metabolism protein UlaG (beta-lactamase superfamily)
MVNDTLPRTAKTISTKKTLKDKSISTIHVVTTHLKPGCKITVTVYKGVLNMFKKTILSMAAVMALYMFSGAGAQAATDTNSAALPTPRCTLIGHATLKIITSEGIVIYIDPYYPGDYSEKADLILVTHEHSDHNKINLCRKNTGCVIITEKDAINKKSEDYNNFAYYGVNIKPVPAANKNHPISKTVGYILAFDGIKLYHAGDTSRLESMAGLAEENIDYAFYPIDGKYNMGAAEAMECAELVGAKHNIPIHFFDADPAGFIPANLLFIPYGDTILLALPPDKGK